MSEDQIDIYIKLIKLQDKFNLLKELANARPDLFPGVAAEVEILEKTLNTNLRSMGYSGPLTSEHGDK